MCLKTQRSCGCEWPERLSARNQKHGMYGTRAYEAWNGMLDRCRNPKLRFWSRYGGRGITVCERWLLFENFVADMGMPLPGLTLDRMDNDGNYEPSNCRWATRVQQRNNRSDSPQYN